MKTFRMFALIEFEINGMDKLDAMHRAEYNLGDYDSKHPYVINARTKTPVKDVRFHKFIVVKES